MAIFNFPVNPISGQTYFAPNGVTYTWDSEKWVGSGSGTFFNPTDFVEKTPDAGNRQSIIPGQPTDTALRLKGASGQAANLLEFESADGTVYSVFDELGRFGYGVLSPTQAIDVIGNIKLTGGIVANNSLGSAGQVLKNDGNKVYWANGASDLDSVLKTGNITNEDMTVGDLVVQGDLTVRGTQTIIDTEVIKLADNIITLNSNYTGNTPNEDAGIQVNRGTLPAKTFYWDETLDRWSVGTEIFKAGLFEGNLVGNVTGTVSSLANHTTDAVREGLNNLYFTQARARQSIASAGDISYNQSTGVISYTETVKSVNGKIGHIVLNADDIVDGTVNKYFNPTNASNWLATKSINDLLDVNTATAAPDDILYFDGTTWTTRPGDFQDNFVTSGNFDFTTGILSHTRNDGNTINVNMDGRYLRLDAGGTVSGATIFDGAIVFNSTVRTTSIPVSNNDVANKLYVDALVANSEVQVQSFAFDATTGQLALTETDSSTFTVDLDGRYVQTVNGIVPDALGNIALSLTGTETGTLAARPATANNGSVYILSGETGVNANTNGETYIYVTSTATWQRIVSFDQAESDIRYINTAGDTMTGTLSLAADPTANLQAATKQYVDALVSNSEIYTANASLDSTTGVLTQTRTDGSTYNVNLYTGLDARYVNVTGDTMTGNLTIDGTLIANNTTLTLAKLADVADTVASANGQVLTWNNTTSAWEARSLPIDGFTTAAVFNTADGIITFTRVDGTTFAVDLDGRYVELPATATSGQVLKYNGTAWVPATDVATANATFNIADGVLTQTRNDGTTYTVDLDGRYAQKVNGVAPDANGNIAISLVETQTGTLAARPMTATSGLIYVVSGDTANNNGETFIYVVGSGWQQIVSFDEVANDSRYVNVSGDAMTGLLTLSADPTANLHAATKAYVDAKVANTEVYTANATLDSTTGVLTQTRNDGTNYTVDLFTGLDGRYVNVTGDTMTGALTLSADPTANLQAATKAYVDAKVANSEVYTSNATFNTTDGIVTQTRTDGTTYTVDLDGRYLELIAGGTVTGATTFSNTVTVSTAPTLSGHVTNKAYVDALVANSEVTVNTFTWTAATGNLALSETDGTSFFVNLDGRYSRTVNGVLPDANGNIALALTETQTGTLAARPLTANSGVIYVISGDTANNNGETFIYVLGTGWQQIVSFDETANDARYVNVSGDTMTGTLTLSSDPTAGLHAATKQYVDTLIANSEVYTANATFNVTDGIVTQTRTDGTSYTVDLDGRYLELTAGGTVTGATTFSNTVTVATTPTLASHVANKAYVDALVSNSEVYTNTAVLDSTTGILTQTRTNGSTYTVDLFGGLDARYVNVAGDTMTGALTLAADPTANLQAATKSYVDALIANSEVFTSNATFNATDGVVTFTRNDLSTYTVDLDGRYVIGPSTANTGQVLTYDGAGWVAANVAANLADLGDVDTTGAANGSILYYNATNSKWETIAGDFVDNFVSSVSFDSTNGSITVTRNDGNTFVTDLDGRWLSMVDGGTVSGNTMFTGLLQTSTAPSTNNDVVNKLYVDALVANSEVYTANATFNTTDGVLTQTRTDGTTYTVDLDGRYVQSVNGIVPAANGNIAISLAETQTGTIAARPMTANAGVVYVVSGDTANNNGETFIYVVGTGWQQIVSFDEAANDARYVNVSGDTMTGTLSLFADPTANLQAATKQYVDALVSNSEVYTSNATLDSTTGVLTQTRTDGTSYTVDIFGGLDARYVNVTGDTMTGALTLASDPTANLQAATKQYVDTLIANSEVYTSNATLDSTTGILTQTRTNGSTYTVDVFTGLDARYVNVAGDTMTGNLTIDGTLIANNTTLTLGKLADVSDTAASANGQVLTWNNVTGAWEALTLPVTVDLSTANATFNTTDGVVTFTKNDSTTYTVDLDGRYAQSVNGIVPAANGNIAISLVETQTGTLGARPITANNGVVYVVSGDTANNNGETFIYVVGTGWQQIVSFDEAANDARYVNVSGDTMTGLLSLSADPTANLHAATKQYVDGLVANSEVYTANATFDSTTGIITQTRTDSTTYTVDLDGRYAQSVNGIVPDVAGNIAVSLTAVQTGTFTARPATATAGVVYVVSGDANTSLNGKTYIYETGSSQWYEVKGFDEAAADARYVNVSGDTMAGTLTLVGDPTANLQAATKQYVDALIANSELYTSNAVFNTTDGVVTFTKNDLSTYTVDLDGRYVELPAGGTSGQVLTYNGTTWAAANAVYTSTATLDNTTGVLTQTRTDGTTYTVDIFGGLDARYVNIAGDTMTGLLSLSADPTANLHAATKQYVDALIANSEVYTSNATLDSTTGILTQTRTDSTTYTVDLFTGLDARYVNVAGDTMTGALTLASDPTANLQAATKQYVDALIANSELYTANATLDNTTGVLTQTRINGSTYTVDLFTGLDGRYVNIAGDTMTGNLVVSANVEVVGTLISNNTTLTIHNLADVSDTAASANGQVLTWNNVTGAWEALTLPAGTTDTFTSNATFDSATGVTTFTKSDLSTYTVDLDGRYLELTAGGTVTGNTIFNGLLQTPTVPSANDDVVNKLYVDTLIANSEVYTSNATLDSTTGILTQTRTNNTTYTVDLFTGLDARYVNVAGDTITGDLIVNGNTTIDGTLIANNTTLTLAKLADVSDIAASANGQVLSWNNVTNEWEALTLPAGTTDTFTANAVFDVATGVTTFTKNDLSTYTVDLDGRYLELTAGGTVTGATTFSNTVTVATVPTLDDHVANKAYVDALIANSEVYTSNATLDSTTGILTQTRTNGSTYTVDLFGGLDARYVNVTGDTITGDLIVNGNTTIDGTLIANNTTLTLAKLADVSDVAASANGQVLSWNNVTNQWEALTLPAGTTDTFTANAVFDTTTGVTTFTKSDSTTYTVDLDGRYLELTAGGTVTGNTIFNGLLQTPTVPSTNNDVVNKLYVDTLIANSEVYTANATLDSTTGILTQTRTDNSTYTVDLFGGLDARYVNVTGDTMTGDLVVNGNTTIDGTLIANNTTLTLAKLADVSDTAASANGQVLSWNNVTNQWEALSLPAGTTDTFTSNATFNATDGVVTFTKNDSTTYTVDLDGRYVELPAGSTSGQVLTYNGTTWAAANTIYTSTAAIDSTTGILTQTRTDGTTYTVDMFTGLDARYVNITGDTITGNLTIDGTLIANNTTLTLAKLADVSDTAASANGQVLSWNNVTNQWEALTLPAGTTDTFTSNAVFDSTTGIVTYTKNDSTTYTVDLDGRYVELPTSATSGQVLKYNGTTWAPATDITTANATFNATDGIVTFTNNDSTTYTVDLDGRWIEAPTATANSRVLTWNNVTNTWYAATPSAAGFDNYITTATYAANNNNQTLTLGYANTSVANLVVDTSHNINSHTDVDTVTKVPVSGSSVFGWDGTNWVPVEVLDANGGTANDF